MEEQISSDSWLGVVWNHAIFREKTYPLKSFSFKRLLENIAARQYPFSGVIGWELPPLSLSDNYFECFRIYGYTSQRVSSLWNCSLAGVKTGPSSHGTKQDPCWLSHGPREPPPPLSLSHSVFIILCTKDDLLQCRIRNMLFEEHTVVCHRRQSLKCKAFHSPTGKSHFALKMQNRHWEPVWDRMWVIIKMRSLWRFLKPEPLTPPQKRVMALMSTCTPWCNDSYGTPASMWFWFLCRRKLPQHSLAEVMTCGAQMIPVYH